MKNRMIAAALSALMAASVAQAGVPGDKAMYRGGSVSVKQGTEAKLDMAGSALRFLDKKTPFEIPYERVQTIEYGQKAGRRIGAAVATAVLVSPLGLFMLMSKKRNHMVSVTWLNAEGKTEAVVLECGKDIIRPVIKTLEARSGKVVEFETEDAKKNLGR
jgi:hypothetical protein